VLDDAMLQESLSHAEIALYDIDSGRLEDSRRMIDALNQNCNEGRARITAHLGVSQRREALKGSNYVANAIQVGGIGASNRSRGRDGHVHENYCADTGAGCGNENSDAFYHWGGLLMS
jgi:alpha-galactosidase/6-phospho-beta-glucosidase family protein